MIGWALTSDADATRLQTTVRRTIHKSILALARVTFFQIAAIGILAARVQCWITTFVDQFLADSARSGQLIRRSIGESRLALAHVRLFQVTADRTSTIAVVLRRIRTFVDEFFTHASLERRIRRNVAAIDWAFASITLLSVDTRGNVAAVVPRGVRTLVTQFLALSAGVGR